MGHVILFDQFWLQGNHKHVVADEPNLAAPEDSSFNDKTLSLVILHGNWELFADINYTSPYLQNGRPAVVGPGTYLLGFPVNEATPTLSSLRETTAAVTQTGGPSSAHVTLFEHAGFRGRHKHVFYDQQTLTDFADITSSMVISRMVPSHPAVEFSDADGAITSPGGERWSTGAYPYVGDVGLPNDKITGLTMSAGLSLPTAGTWHGDESFGEIILFEHENFRGRHRHVYLGEWDLGASDDPAFASITSSFYIESGAWALFRRSGCQEFLPSWDTSGFAQETLDNDDFDWGRLKAPPYFLPGAYPSAAAVGVTNDAVMSVRMPVPDIWYFNAAHDDVSALDGTDNVWEVFVTGPHAPGAAQLTLDATTTVTDLTLSQQPNAREIGDYRDSTGHAWAHTYVAERRIRRRDATPMKVSCPTDGRFGTTQKTNEATRPASAAPPPPPPPVAHVIVPNVVGLLLSQAITALDAVSLLYNTITPPGEIRTDQLRVTSQSPSAGTSVAVHTTVDVAVVAVTTTPSGYSKVQCRDTSPDTGYDIWTYHAGAWAKQGAIAAAGQLSVTLPAGAVRVCAYATGVDPRTATEPERAREDLVGDSSGPIAIFQFS